VAATVAELAIGQKGQRPHAAPCPFKRVGRTRDARAVLHYVLEESSARAIDVCSQSYPDHRIVSMRDVTHQATAA